MTALLKVRRHLTRQWWPHPNQHFEVILRSVRFTFSDCGRFYCCRLRLLHLVDTHVEHYVTWLLMRLLFVAKRLLSPLSIRSQLHGLALHGVFLLVEHADLSLAGFFPLSVQHLLDEVVSLVLLGSHGRV